MDANSHSSDSAQMHLKLRFQKFDARSFLTRPISLKHYKWSNDGDPHGDYGSESPVQPALDAVKSCVEVPSKIC